MHDIICSYLFGSACCLLLSAAICCVLLPDGPEHAFWLNSQEKRAICNARAPQVIAGGESNIGSLAASVSAPAFWLLWPVLFVLNMAIYGITMWLPLLVGQLFQSSESWLIDAICSLPPLCATISVFAMSCLAHKCLKQYLQMQALGVMMMLGSIHIVASLGNGAADKPLVILLLCISMASLWASVPTFFVLASETLSPRDYGTSIALVNAMGHLALCL